MKVLKKGKGEVLVTRARLRGCSGQDRPAGRSYLKVAKPSVLVFLEAEVVLSDAGHSAQSEASGVH